MFKSLTSITFCLLFSFSLFSQEAFEILPPEQIKTITFNDDSNQIGFPVIRLGNSFSIEFDVLNGYEDDYYYKIDHYNFDWTKSQLSKSEYLKGYDNSKIYNYKNSFNTYQIYSHYNLTIPNQETKIIKSGNYIVSILNDYEEVVFSKKIIVYESLSTLLFPLPLLKHMSLKFLLFLQLQGLIDLMHAQLLHVKLYEVYQPAYRA